MVISRTPTPYVPNAVFFAMEYFEHGDLYQYLNSPQGASCAEEDAEFIANQLLQALNIMHGLGFAHRDLKHQVCPRSNNRLRHVTRVILGVEDAMPTELTKTFRTSL